MTVSLATTLSYYKRRDIQEALVYYAKDKEIAYRFDESFGKRPDTLTYPADVLEMAKNKMTSIHCSEELWTNPSQITTGMKKEDLNALRKGWDLVLDIDCKVFEYSRQAAFHVIQLLKGEGVKSITAKFSGNKGFHIAVPFEAFPKELNGKKMAEWFPEAPRRIAAYITHGITRPLGRDISQMEGGNFIKIAEKVGLKPTEINNKFETNEFGDKKQVLNVEPFLEIDTILIASRHLYRMPYSLHEKSGLVSVPIKIDKVLEFEKTMAKPENVVVENVFLDRKTRFSDAEKLLRNAFDFAPIGTQSYGHEIKESISSMRKEYEIPEQAIGEDLFPPCIKLILNGLEDGKKRSSFALINFLASCGWDYDAIEKRLIEWNQKNSEPLRDNYLVGQIRYAKVQNKKAMPPPSCNNPNYYKGLQVCKPDELCARIRNPLQYAKLKNDLAQKIQKQNEKAPRKKREEPSGEVEFD